MFCLDIVLVSNFGHRIFGVASGNSYSVVPRCQIYCTSDLCLAGEKTGPQKWIESEIGPSQRLVGGGDIVSRCIDDDIAMSGPGD